MSQNQSKKTSGIKKAFANPNTRRGAISVSITVLVIAALVLVNVIFGILSDRKAMYIDVTADRIYKLQSETVDYIENLDQDVDIYVFADEEVLEKNDSVNYQYFLQANRLLHEFEYNSDKITLHYVDLIKNPTFLSKYPNVDRTKTYLMLVTCGENYIPLESSDVFNYDTDLSQQMNYDVVSSQHMEQAITSAILKAIDTDHVTVSVMLGHGEEDCTAFLSSLVRNAYDIEFVESSQDTISKESEFLLIHRPESDIDEETYKMITDWLNDDAEYGHSVIYIPNDRYSVDLYPNINALLADYGMEVDYACIVEEDENYVAPMRVKNPLITLFDYADPEFTETLQDRSKRIIMGSERGTLPIKILDDSIATEMLVSSAHPLRLDLKTMNTEQADGYLYSAVIGSKKNPSAKDKNSSVVVIGSGDAVSNAYLSSRTYNNEEYFINVVNTLSHKDDIGIIIEGKDPSSTELGISSTKDLNFLSALVRFIIPGLVVIIGLVVWIRRRHK